MQWFGRIGGPLLAVTILFLPESIVGGDLTPHEQRLILRTAAIATLMALWWMTEALPLPATSLLPLVLFPLSGVLTFEGAATPYANKFVFLFLGGFMIARAIEKWHLHLRIALLTVLAVGTRPIQLIAGFMIATAVLSMWISNTASTVLMLPIGMSLVALISQQLSDGQELSGRAGSNFANCMMLGIAYSASIGGMSTLVGTPTNLFLAGFAGEQGIEIAFVDWMLFASPLSAVFLVITWLLLTRFIFPISIPDIPGGRQLIRGELSRLGRVQRGEWIVLIVFMATAACWVVRGPVSKSDWFLERAPFLAQVSDATIALVGALLLFVIPVDVKKGVFALDWKTAESIPWGVLLLFGGGFSLATAVSSSGLAEWIGESVRELQVLPTFLLVVVVVAMVVFLTELTSNTPTAAAFLPILYGVALKIDVDPFLFIVPATLAATCAFMLPVATPPNAIVFGSGHVTIRSMIKAGVCLNLFSIVLIPVWMWLVGEWAF